MTATVPPHASTVLPHAAGARAGLDVPGWALRLVEPAREGVESTGFGRLHRREGGAATLATVVVPDALDLDREGFRKAVLDAYVSLHGAAAATRCTRIVRAWNFLPEIHAGMGGGLDRYRVFNAARFEAFGELKMEMESPPTATGIGHAGSSLEIHVLALREPGLAVENPRQVPAYRYSARFGPRPPCFSRATLARAGADTARLLIGGTASVRGEESLWEGDLAGQLEETGENLRALIVAAEPRALLAGAALRLTSLRAYVRHAEDDASVLAFLSRFAPRAELEVRRAEVCRRELLVEVEGVAALSENAETPV